MMRPASTVVATPRPSRVELAAPRAPAAATPVPQVVIATPEGGMDYETAVLANIYREVNPSVVNVTILSQPLDTPEPRPRQRRKRGRVIAPAGPPGASEVRILTPED